MASQRTTRQVAGGQAGALPSSRPRAFWFVAYNFAVAYGGLTVPVIGLGVASDYVGALVATLARIKKARARRAKRKE